MVTDDPNWPLPSQSLRVRIILYLGEGMIGGAAIAYLLATFAALFVDIETGEFDPAIPAVEMGLLLILVIILLRGIAFLKLSRRFTKEEQTESRSWPEYLDWNANRQWSWTIALALFIAGVIMGVSVTLWGWWETAYSQNARILAGGILMGGGVLYFYTFHRLGVEHLTLPAK